MQVDRCWLKTLMAHKGSTLLYCVSFSPRSDHSKTINGMQLSEENIQPATGEGKTSIVYIFKATHLTKRWHWRSRWRESGLLFIFAIIKRADIHSVEWDIVKTRRWTPALKSHCLLCPLFLSLLVGTFMNINIISQSEVNGIEWLPSCRRGDCSAD